MIKNDINLPAMLAINIICILINITELVDGVWEINWMCEIARLNGLKGVTYQTSILLHTYNK